MKKYLLLSLLAISVAPAVNAEDKIVPAATLSGHPGGVYSLAFSSDSKVLVSAGQNGTINLWSTKDFHSMRTWKDHSDSVNSIFFSPDGKTLVSGGDDQTILIRSATDYTIEERIAAEGKVSALAQAPAGKTMAAVLNDKEVRFLEGKNYTPAKTFDGNAVAFSNDRRLAALTGPDNRIKIIDQNDLGIANVLIGHKNAIRSIAFSPNGSMLATGSEDRTLRIWDPRAFKQMSVIKTGDLVVSALAFSVDGRFLAYAGTVVKDGTPYRFNDTAFHVWDFARGKEAASISGHRGAVLSLAFSPDKKWLVSGSADKTIKVWDVSKWTPKAKPAVIPVPSKKK